ncbi:MAG: hypothetical protein JWM77_1522 [Rhodospirillales bacterium]|nr:hypothetical protein [Rhodospirillales bacterium]
MFEIVRSQIHVDAPSGIEAQILEFRRLAKGRIAPAEVERAVDRARTVAQEFARHARNYESASRVEEARELTGEGWSIVVSLSTAPTGLWSRMKRALVG